MFFTRIYFFLLVLIAIEMLTVTWLAPSGADTRDASWITGQGVMEQQHSQSPPSIATPYISTALQSILAGMGREQRGETQICFQAYIFSFIFCHTHVTLPGVTCSCKNSHFSFIETAYKSLCFSNDVLYITNTCCTQKLISLKYRDQRYSTFLSLIKWSFTSDRPQCFWQIVFESDWRYGYAFLNTLQSKNDVTTMLLLWGTSIDCLVLLLIINIKIYSIIN